MDGISVVRVYRQVTIRRSLTNQLPEGIRLVPQPDASAAEQRNNRCCNALILLTIYTVGIGAIVLGAIHLKNCPAQNKLPEGLIILGGIFIIARLLNFVYDVRSVCNAVNTDNVPGFLMFLNVVFLLAEFGVFVAVCYWNFSIRPTTKPEEQTLPNYCDPMLYNISYWGCVAGSVFYGLPILCCCVLVCIGASS